MARMRTHSILSAALVFLAVARPVAAQGRQEFADLGTCPTAGGGVVLDCRIGYRTFGRLNAGRDNAVLVPSWHGGRSGTMTFILGAGGWVDTTRYFAILMDKPGNGVSTSPSNSRSQPGRTFPRLTMGDIVAAQHRVVVKHLGIGRLHAVVGWSMGGMQAIEWALRFPDAAGRIVSVAGTPRMDNYEMYFIRSMLTLIDLGTRSGLAADTLALRLADLWHTVATTPAHENAQPRDSIAAMIAVEARQDWVGFHPEDNHLQLEAIAAFDALGEVTRDGAPPAAPMRLIFMPEDHLTTAESFRVFARLTGADTVAFPSRCGHMAPVCDTAGIGEHVREYLDADLPLAGTGGRRPADSQGGPAPTRARNSGPLPRGT